MNFLFEKLNEKFQEEQYQSIKEKYKNNKCLDRFIFVNVINIIDKLIEKSKLNQHIKTLIDSIFLIIVEHQENNDGSSDEIED